MTAKSYDGSLDFIEFCLDPKNQTTETEEYLYHTREYLKILGMDDFQIREWLLTRLKEERKKHE